MARRSGSRRRCGRRRPPAPSAGPPCGPQTRTVKDPCGRRIGCRRRRRPARRSPREPGPSAEPRGSACRSRRSRKVRRRDAVREFASEGFQRTEAPRPIVAVAGVQPGAVALDAKLHPVAVELNLVDPASPGRRLHIELAQLERREVRRAGLSLLGHFRPLRSHSGLRVLGRGISTR